MLPFELTDAATERELFALAAQERLARDTRDWDLLAASYWPDSVVRVTWFTGTAADFVEASRERAKRGGGFHVITPVRAKVVGDRGVVESRGEIHIRPRLHDVQCDVVSWGRFYSRAERRDGVWRLRTFDSIYGKDRVDPVDPAARLELDANVLATARDSYRHLAYLNLHAGYPVPEDLPGDDRPDLTEAFVAEAEAWLRGEDAEPGARR
jgi:SnoaL-like domain